MFTLSLEGAAAFAVLATDSATVSAGIPFELNGGGRCDRKQIRHLLSTVPS